MPDLLCVGIPSEPDRIVVRWNSGIEGLFRIDGNEIM